MAGRKQRTIERPVTMEGVGLHTDLASRVVFRPAAPGSGVVLRRIDVEGSAEISVASGTVLHRARRTTMSHDDLMAQGVEVQTVEHLLSALKGLRIDNLLVEVNNVEMPGADGSALPGSPPRYSCRANTSTTSSNRTSPLTS